MANPGFALTTAPPPPNLSTQLTRKKGLIDELDDLSFFSLEEAIGIYDQAFTLD